MTYFSSPPLSPRDPRYAIPAGARPRTGRSYAPYVPAGDVPGAPTAVLGDGSRVAGDRDLAPRRVAVPRGSGFVMFRNPFPPGRRREQPPVRPREQGVRGPYRYEFAG